MRLGNFKETLKTAEIEYTENVPMSLYTTFKVGGNADVLVKPKTQSELETALLAARENGVPVFILGNGSNLLVSDKGIEGAVVSMLSLNFVKVSGNEIVCGAGARLSAVCIAARDAGLTGLEFAYGIPGTVGGAFYMNAGAYGGEIANVAISAECIDADGKPCCLSAAEMEFGYRTSVFKKGGLVITAVKLRLENGKREEITAAMNGYMKRRAEKQPLEYPSAGSTFKRPTGYYAGALIEGSGLKGASVGGAQVSEKHAGFIINRGNATADDVCALIEKVKNTVLAAEGVTLEPEVLFVGRKE